MFANKLASKMAIAFAAQLLCACTAKEDLASMPDVCSSSGGSRACDPQTVLDAQLLQLRDAEAHAYSKVHDCTSGTWYGTQYTETQTPDIDDCAQICQTTSGCSCFTYGNPSGFVGTVSGVQYTSDGIRDHDCILTSDCSFVEQSAIMFCRWNVYSLAPTPAPAAVTNDPHVASLGGDRFDVNQPADYVLLRAPLEYSQPALLELRGTMEPEGSKPCGLYMKAATLSGTWFGEAIVQVRPLKRNNAGSNTEGNSTVWPFSMQVSPEGSWKSLADFTAESSSEALTGMVKITAEKIEEYGELLEGQAFTFHIGKTDRPATITISQAAHQALNVEMANMQALGHQTLGGLLGTEKHSKGVEELTEACKAHRASANEWRASRKSLEVSRMSASWL